MKGVLLKIWKTKKATRLSSIECLILCTRNHHHINTISITKLQNLETLQNKLNLD